jgi:hypothetical protein
MSARIVVEAGEQAVFPKVLGVSASNKFLTRSVEGQMALLRSIGSVRQTSKRERDHWFVCTADERELIPTGSYASFLS